MALADVLDRLSRDGSIRLTPDGVFVVQVFYGDAEDVEPIAPLLGAEERARAARFVRDRDRARYVAAHALTRVILGRCLDAPPASLAFDAGRRGKPALRDPARDVRFNISHAGNCVMVGAALGRELGVDVERERSIDAALLARRFFSDREREQLAALGASQLIEGFYRCWTRKESFIKALGEGTAFPLRGFDMSLQESAPQLLLACPAAPREEARWTTVSIDTRPGYAAAATIEGRGWRIDERVVEA